MVDAASACGAESVVMGMAHRGRLNILNNVFGKPLGVICTEMKSEGRSSFNVGDVRYHLGTRTTVRLEPINDPSTSLTGIDSGINDGEDGDGRGGCGGGGGVDRPGPIVELSMAPNPSHLEAVNAVVAGMVRSKQMRHDPVGRGAV